MKPTEKRDAVVKQIIKPLLKKNGFTISGLNWHREVSDSYIIIHMFNSQFNSIVTGARFRFHISMSKTLIWSGSMCAEIILPFPK